MCAWRVHAANVHIAPNLAQKISPHADPAHYRYICGRVCVCACVYPYIHLHMVRALTNYPNYHSLTHRPLTQANLQTYR